MMGWDHELKHFKKLMYLKIYDPFPYLSEMNLTHPYFLSDYLVPH